MLPLPGYPGWTPGLLWGPTWPHAALSGWPFTPLALKSVSLPTLLSPASQGSTFPGLSHWDAWMKRGRKAGRGLASVLSHGPRELSLALTLIPSPASTPLP